MTGPNYQTMLTNKKATVRMRVAEEAPLDVVKSLLNDPNKRVRRHAEKRVKDAKG